MVVLRDNKQKMAYFICSLSSQESIYLDQDKNRQDFQKKRLPELKK